jgi:glutamyl-tRNA reductase
MSGELGLVGPRLRLLFEEAFRAAKRVRSDTGVARRPVSMISLTTGLLEERLGESGGCLALIGAGDMTRQCAEVFSGWPGVELLFVNRSFSGAEALAERFGGAAVALEGFRRDPGRVDALVTSTAAPEPILDGSLLRRIGERLGRGAGLLIIDLAVPRDVDPEAAAELGARLYDIDRLESVAARNRQERQEEVAEARVVLDESLDSLRRRMVDREMAPLVRALHRRYQRTVDEGLERLFGNGGEGLGREQEERIRRWAGSLVKRFAHIPTLGLKSLAFDRGSEAVESFLEGVRAELGLERLDGGDESRMQAGPRGGEESLP